MLLVLKKNLSRDYSVCVSIPVCYLNVGNIYLISNINQTNQFVIFSYNLIKAFVKICYGRKKKTNENFWKFLLKVKKIDNIHIES